MFIILASNINLVSEIPHWLNASENAGPRRGWIVRSHIDWGGEWNTLYKGVENSP